MNRPIKKDANYVKNLVDYAKKNIQKGYTADSLRWALVNQGHSRIEVDKALTMAQSEVTKQSMSEARAQTKAQQQPQVQVDVEPEKQSFWKRMFS